MPPELACEALTVGFGGLLALDDVSLEVTAGSVTGLIGPNGAGKTTLFNVVCGLQRPRAGRVRLDGRDVTGKAPHRRARLGLARTFQRLEVFGSLTAFENVLVAAEIRRSWSREGDDPAAVARACLDRTGLGPVADRQVDTLPTGHMRLVEVARALASRPRVLLLDEPSSGLDDGESEALGALLCELAGSGLAVLLVEHDVPLVMSVCHHIDVLDFGRVIASGPPEQIQADARVRAAYLGGEPVLNGGGAPRVG